MKVSTIELEHTGRFNRLILDHVQRAPQLNTFYELPHTVDNYEQKIRQRKHFPLDREVLADALMAQYASIGGATEQVRSNIEALRNEDTFTITTGHQLNIFTGPLYFVYKILHTIKLADELNRTHSKQHFVPVYWMNSEDHDLDEIAHFNLFGKRYVWKTEQTGATGRMHTDGLAEVCDALEEVFSNDPATKELIGLFRKAYTSFPDLATATRYFANELFGSYGLVILNSDDASLKRLFTEQIKTDTFDQLPFRAVKESSLQLAQLNYHVQVNPREINSFYLTDGGRNRIVRTEKGFHVLHTDLHFTEQELEQEIETHPERFSPNVVLRPLFQEHILPNLTYVGGAGELSYWLQYRHCFEQMNVSYPMLALRNHFLLIDPNVGKKIEELGLRSHDLFLPVDDLIRQFVLQISVEEVALTEEREQLRLLYTSLMERAKNIDPSLVASVEAEMRKMEKTLAQWEARFTRSLKKKNEVSVNRIKAVHAKLFPNGYLQERHDNLLAFYGQDPENWFSTLHAATDPFDTRMRVLFL